MRTLHQNSFKMNSIALKPDFPVRHLVQFVEHDQTGGRRPALRQHDAAIRGDVPVEYLRIGPGARQGARKRGLPRLPGTGQKDHLAGQIGLDKGSERAFHSDYFPVD